MSDNEVIRASGESMSVRSEAASGSNDPFERLAELLAEYREDIWREYQIVQQKIDNATRFRMVTVGWTMTGASVAPIVIAQANLSWHLSLAALGFTSLILFVIHKLSIDQLTTGLNLGRHAKQVEGELYSAKRLRFEVLGRVAAGGASVQLRARIRASSSDYRMKRAAREPGVKRSDEERLYHRAIGKCDEKYPQVANAVTGNRLGWADYLRVIFFIRRSQNHETHANAVNSSQEEAARKRSRLAGERESALLRNLQESLWIVRVQLAFLIVGGVLILGYPSEPAERLEGAAPSAQQIESTGGPEADANVINGDVIAETPLDVTRTRSAANQAAPELEEGDDALGATASDYEETSGGQGGGQ